MRRPLLTLVLSAFAAGGSIDLNAQTTIDFDVPNRIAVDGIMLFGRLTSNTGPLDILGAPDGGPFPHTKLRVYKNDGAGSVLSTPIDTSTPLGATHPKQTLLADLNNDGFDDVVMVADEGIYVIVNDGAGRFSAQPVRAFTRNNGYLPPGVPGNPNVLGNFRANRIAVGRTSPNGNVDVFISGLDWRNWLLKGNGDGTFQTNPVFINSQGYTIGKSEFVDVEGNGFPALVATSGYLLQVYRNNQNGTFGTGPTTTPSSSLVSNTGNPYFAVNSAFIDMDGDSNSDLVLSTADWDGSAWTGSIKVYQNLGAARFNPIPTVAYVELPRPQAYNPSTGVWYSENNFYQTISPADIDGDGQVDLFASAGQLGQPTVLRNNGDGTFSLAWLSSLTDINNTTGNDTRGNAAFGLRLDYVDFNGTGEKYLFASNFRNNSFQVQTPWGENYGPNIAKPRDTTPPVITPPANVVAEAAGPAGAVVAFSATAQDDVDGSVNVTASQPSGGNFPIGTTTVNLSAADAAGNVATASFNVTVRDTVAPTITPVADIIAEATSAAGAVVTFEASATDVVGVTSFSSSVPSVATFPIGNTTVILTATDAAGNSASSPFTVSVRDTVAPVLNVPVDQILEATSPAGAVANFTVTATDAVGVVSLTSSTVSGSTLPIGTTTVNILAEDAAGNRTLGSFRVTVMDSIAPVISSLSASKSLLWPPNHKMVPITLRATASDIVGVSSLRIIQATSNEPDNGLGDGDVANDIQITGALSLNLRAERSGKGNGRIYTITVEAKDSVGNLSTKTVTVSVPKRAPDDDHSGDDENDSDKEREHSHKEKRGKDKDDKD